MTEGGDGPRVFSHRRAVLLALVSSGVSLFLVGLSTLITALTCGDDGPVDYGTAGGAAKRLCSASSGDVELVYITTGIVVVAVGALLAVTGRLLWLRISLALIGLLGAWVLGQILFLG